MSNNSNIQDLFLPYELALKSKDFGNQLIEQHKITHPANSPLLAMYCRHRDSGKVSLWTITGLDISPDTQQLDHTFEEIAAPTYDQILRFFDDKFIFINTQISAIGSDEWVFSYTINYLPKEFENKKRRMPHFEEIISYNEYMNGTYEGGWDKKSDCLNAAITKAFELI